MDDAQLENINEKKKMFPPKKMTPKQAKEYKKFIGYAKNGSGISNRYVFV